MLVLKNKSDVCGNDAVSGAECFLLTGMILKLGEILAWQLRERLSLVVICNGPSLWVENLRCEICYGLGVPIFLEGELAFAVVM